MTEKKIHQVINIQQHACLKEYIDCTTKKRDVIKTKFKQSIRLLWQKSLSFSGETVENARNQKYINFVGNVKSFSREHNSVLCQLEKN